MLVSFICIRNRNACWIVLINICPTELALKYLQDIAKELSAIPMIEAKIQPLNQLHSSLLKTKENIQKEEELRNELVKVFLIFSYEVVIF